MQVGDRGGAAADDHPLPAPAGPSGARSAVICLRFAAGWEPGITRPLYPPGYTHPGTTPVYPPGPYPTRARH